MWTSVQQESFETLKEAVSTAPILKIVDPERSFVLETDASGVAVGAVLSQDGRPIAFESKKLSLAQRNWPVHEQELYAIIHALKTWRHYLYGAQFKVYTDHHTLKYFSNQPDLRGRQGRWAELMQEFHMEILYRNGRDNVVADALSRIVNNMSFTVLENSLLQEIKEAQQQDPYAQKVKARLESRMNNDEDLASSTSSLHRISSPYANFSVENGWLKRKGKLYVPCARELRAKVLQENHDSPCAGHPGQDKTGQLVRRTFWWPHLYRDVHKYVQQCFQCQVIKAERIKPPGLLHPLQIPESNWQSISMDFIIGLPMTQRQKDTILVIVDRLSKMAHFIPTKETVEAPQVAELFIQNVFRIHGLPTSIVSDRDVRFCGHFWRHIFDKLHVTLNMSSGDHPETDGQTERVNQVLEDMLRAYVSERQTDWDLYLPLLEFAYNKRPHKVTGMSPFEMNYGMIPLSPDTKGTPQKCPSAAHFLARMQETLRLAKVKLQQAADRAKYYADKKRSARVFKEGEKVFLQVPLKSTSLSTGKCPKLLPRFCGPWTIIKKLSDVAYRLELPPGCRIHPVFHVSKLKKYISKDTNVIDGFVSLQENETTDHSPDKILDRREKRLRNRILREFLVAWKGLPLTDATWESEALIRKYFPQLIIEDDDLRRGTEC